MKTKSVELRPALRLRIGQRLAEAGRRRINLHDVSLALGVSERTLRNWRNLAKKDVPKMGRPSYSDEFLENAKKTVYEEMKRQGAPGWRPIAFALKGKVPVRLIQKFVTEYKNELKINKRGLTRVQVNGKNIIWSMDGAITKEKEKIENQVIKDRGTRCWVGIKSSKKASCSQDVVDALTESFKNKGIPLVLSTDNGSAQSNKEVSELLEHHKVIHLKSLPRTPQHNGAVEVGIKELREIMRSGQTNLKTAMNISNNRLKIYGNKWSTPSLFFENADMPYNKNDHDLFYFECSRRLMDLRKEPLSFRQMRLKEREIIFEELEKRGFVTKWKVTKYS
ncbi:MAG: transposase family protein [Bacteriovoracaceae bacterium]